MTPTPVMCDLCGHPIDVKNPSTYRITMGWTKRRGQGGTNAVRLPKYGDRFAHEACVDLASKGIAPKQESML